MRKRLLLIALGALVFQGSCSEKAQPFFSPGDGASATGNEGGESGEPATGGVNTGGANIGGANIGGTGGTSTGGANTGGTSTGGANTGGNGGAPTGGRSGNNGGGRGGGNGGSNLGGSGGSTSGAGGVAGAGGAAAGRGGNGGARPVAGAGGMAGSAGVLAGAGGAGNAGRGVGGAGMAGQGGKSGKGGSGGSSDQVLVRAESFRATAAMTSVVRAPAIQGQDGLLLAHIVYDDTGATSDAPNSGFELVATATRATGDIIVMRIYWKIASGPAGQMTTEPGSYSITNSDDRYQDLLLFAVYGYDPVAPISASTTSSGATAAMSVAGIGVLRPGSLGVWWKAGFNAATSINPNGFTMLSQDQDLVNDIGWRVLPVGVTGPITATQEDSSSWANAFVVLQPP